MATRVFPCSWRPKQFALLLAALALAAPAAGCGGDERRGFAHVRGSGFGFDAASDWRIERTGRRVAAVDDGREVSVTTFRLARPYRPELWERAVTELDAVAGRLARELGGSVTERATRVVAGARAREYRLTGTRDGTRRIGFVLRGRSEYQLLCRGDAEEECDTLFSSFTLRRR